MSDHVDPSKRPRTPKPRYSPDAQRRQPPRSAMSALSIETSRNTDLNADGTGPSTSGSNPPVSGGSERRESRRRDDSTRRKTTIQAPGETPKSHKRSANSAGRSRKRRSPSPAAPEDAFMEEQRDFSEWENLPIVVDDPSYTVTADQKALFLKVMKSVQERIQIAPGELAEIYRRADDVRLPRAIHFGRYVMDSWYGSPFPLEFARIAVLHVCEFCLYYARTESVMQNHSRKCQMRAPPGVEIYRKENISVFEVDGRKQRDYCQNICLVARLFLDSKTLFYDTDPFLFYIVTVNDEIGCHFAGYFSKEKYEPDKNNLSCIMTLPCYQSRGFGSFLIDVSYALSRREKWFGGPEQPLSDLGRIAYGSYWRGAIFKALDELKANIEGGEGLSVDDISQATGIFQHDVCEFADAMGWLQKDPVDKKIKWHVDWGLITMYFVEKRHCKKTKFDEKFLDWEPRKITPKMDSFVELTQQEVEEDEETMRRKSHQQTPMSSASLLKSTPASSTRDPTGSSIKKTLRSRGTRAVGRNLKLEISKKVTVPSWAAARDVTDDETEEKTEKKKKKRKRATCQEPATEKSAKREDSPEDDAGPSTSTSRPGRRSRNRPADDPPPPPAVTPGKGARGGKQRNSKNSKGKKMYEVDSDDDMPSSSSSSDDDDDDDDDVPFGAQKGKRGGKNQKQVRSGKLTDEEKEEKVKEEEETMPRTASVERMEVDEVEKEEEKKEEEPQDELEEEEAVNNNDLEEELGRDYIIGTPESYHSTPPASPPPQLAEEALPPPQIFGNEQHNLSHHSHHSHHEQQDRHDQHLLEQHQFEENDAAPPLLVSEVSNLSVSDPNDHNSDAQPSLAPNLADGDGYSTGDDEAPPRLSPQYDKHESHEEEEKEEAAPPILMPPTLNGMQEYPIASGMHMTPQMMPSSSQSQNHNSNPNMMASTPQHPFSHHGPNSQTTPGSGGIPSCGPAYNHSTPEQQAAQQQQFMSPMAGMPASVSSVHSVHNASMEMVGGPSSIQHTPQQYDMGAHMGQMPPDQGVMSNGSVAAIEQQNQLMMAQRGFNSPPANGLPPPQQQPPQVPQVAPMPAAPAPTNARRRSDTAAQRKRNQTRAAAAAPQMPNPMAQMPHPMMMNGYYNNFMHGMQGYPGYNMWDPIYGAYPYAAAAYQMPDAMNYPRGWVPYPQVQPQAQVPQNGHMPVDGGAGVPGAAPIHPFPNAAAQQWFNYQQNR